VLGLDTVPIQTRSVPRNCHFQICDANDGLPFPANSFDVVHMRFVESGVSVALLLVPAVETGPGTKVDLVRPRPVRSSRPST
jgi:hypothetical protein